MFTLDWIFIVILAVLIGLPFTSIYPCFNRFPYELFYSALGSASIAVMAWERIASSRIDQLRRLMKQVYLDSDEFGLYHTLRGVCNCVRRRDGLSGEESKKIQQAVSILERSGRFRKVDRLYPRGVLDDLRELAPWIEKYLKDWGELNARIAGFAKEEPNLNFQLLWAMAKGQVELLEKEGLLVPYFWGSTNRANRYAALEREQGGKAITFIQRLKQQSSYMRRIEDSTWSREILERASGIRDRFNSFLISHGLESPTGSDENWIEGGGVIDRTGPVI